MVFKRRAVFKTDIEDTDYERVLAIVYQAGNCDPWQLTEVLDGGWDVVNAVVKEMQSRGILSYQLNSDDRYDLLERRGFY